MSKLNRATNLINLSNNLSEMEDQIQLVKNSILSEEEKNKAFKAYGKMVKTATVIVVISAILMFILFSIGFSSKRLEFTIIPLIAFPILIIIWCIVAKKRKKFADWTNAYEKVYNGFDGLDEETINKLKPNFKEKRLIKKYMIKILVSGIIFILTLAIEIYVFLQLEIDIVSHLTIIIIIITTIIWYVFEVIQQENIHMIKSEYYKKSVSFSCDKCQSEIKIKFQDLEKYNSLSRNKEGIRVLNCPNCGDSVPLSYFDDKLNEYKKYLEKLEKV